MTKTTRQQGAKSGRVTMRERLYPRGQPVAHNAPPAGAYTGTVNGCNAIIVAGEAVMYASWVRQDWQGNIFRDADFWLIFDGKYYPDPARYPGTRPVQPKLNTRKQDATGML
jgi:hypothetical protein